MNLLPTKRLGNPLNSDPLPAKTPKLQLDEEVLHDDDDVFDIDNEINTHKPTLLHSSAFKSTETQSSNVNFNFVRLTPESTKDKLNGSIQSQTPQSEASVNHQQDHDHDVERELEQSFHQSLSIKSNGQIKIDEGLTRDAEAKKVSGTSEIGGGNRDRRTKRHNSMISKYTNCASPASVCQELVDLQLHAFQKSNAKVQPMTKLPASASNLTGTGKSTSFNNYSNRNFHSPAAAAPVPSYLSSRCSSSSNIDMRPGNPLARLFERCDYQYQNPKPSESQNQKVNMGFSSFSDFQYQQYHYGRAYQQRSAYGHHAVPVSVMNFNERNCNSPVPAMI